ncbi:hypothetical protein QT986_06895 [Microcoleus sp. herbarium14]
MQLTAGAIEQSRRQPAGTEIYAQIPARIRAIVGLWEFRCDRTCNRIRSRLLLLLEGKLAKLGVPLNNCCLTLCRN